nr:hypothetical protein [Tanacetum cinerariifolium]
PGVPDGQAVQTIILNNAAFQTEDLDTYDSDSDDISNAKAVLMANTSNYGSHAISKSPQVTTQLVTESPLVDSGYAILVFCPGDDLIACLNKAMAYLWALASSRFPSTNNQLRTSSNPRNNPLS